MPFSSDTAVTWANAKAREQSSLLSSRLSAARTMASKCCNIETLDRSCYEMARTIIAASPMKPA